MPRPRLAPLALFALAPAAALATPQDRISPDLLADAGAAAELSEFPGSLSTLPGNERLEIEFDHNEIRQGARPAPAPSAPDLAPAAPGGLLMLGESLGSGSSQAKGSEDWSVDFGDQAPAPGFDGGLPPRDDGFPDRGAPRETTLD